MPAPDAEAKSEHELLLDDFAELLKALVDWRKVIHLRLNGYTIMTYTFDFATLMLPSSTSEITVHDDWGPQPPEPDWRAIGHGQTPTVSDWRTYMPMDEAGPPPALPPPSVEPDIPPSDGFVPDQPDPPAPLPDMAWFDVAGRHASPVDPTLDDITRHAGELLAVQDFLENGAIDFTRKIDAAFHQALRDGLPDFIDFPTLTEIRVGGRPRDLDAADAFGNALGDAIAGQIAAPPQAPPPAFGGSRGANLPGDPNFVYQPPAALNPIGVEQLAPLDVPQIAAETPNAGTSAPSFVNGGALDSYTSPAAAGIAALQIPGVDLSPFNAPASSAGNFTVNQGFINGSSPFGVNFPVLPPNEPSGSGFSVLNLLGIGSAQATEPPGGVFTQPVSLTGPGAPDFSEPLFPSPGEFLHQAAVLGEGGVNAISELAVGVFKAQASTNEINTLLENGVSLGDARQQAAADIAGIGTGEIFPPANDAEAAVQRLGGVAVPALLPAGLGFLSKATGLLTSTETAESLNTVAQVENGFGALVDAPNTGAGSTFDQLQEAATQAAQQVGPGRGPVYGTQVHSAFQDLVDGLGNPDLSTEQSYLNGRIVDFGTPGSVRLDVVEGPLGDPTAIYDLKTGSATLTPSRILQIQSHLPGNGSNVPVYEVRP